MPFQIAVKGFVDDVTGQCCENLPEKSSTPTNVGAFQLEWSIQQTFACASAWKAWVFIGGLTGDHPSSEPSRDFRKFHSCFP